MAAKGSFISTRWSVIRRAQADGPEARIALGQLVMRYDGFIEAALRRARRPPDLTLDDAKQEFLEQVPRLAPLRREQPRLQRLEALVGDEQPRAAQRMCRFLGAEHVAHRGAAALAQLCG
jgi:hypothetical protein